MDEAIQFREATSADAAVITRFQVAMAAETEEMVLDGQICGRGVLAVFEDPSRGRYFVAASAGEIVASLLLTPEWSDWRNGTVWWIQSVFVTAPFRRRGVYAGLYAHVHGIVAKDATARGIRLYVDRRNVAAQEVYTRLGMNGEHYQVFEWMKD